MILLYNKIGVVRHSKKILQQEEDAMREQMKIWSLVVLVSIFIALYFFVGARITKNVHQTSTIYHLEIQQIQ